MSPSNQREGASRRRPEPVAELSAEERQVLTRIQKQAGRKRPNQLRRFLKNPPLFFWWWHW